MAQRIEDELASERAKVNALQEEIARLRHELQSTPPKSRGRGGPLSPASQPPRIRPEPLQSSPLAATSPARTSTGGPGTLVAPRTPLHTSTQSHSTPASRRETPPPPTASASHQWQGQRPSRGSPRVSSSPGTPVMRGSSAGRMQTVSGSPDGTPNPTREGRSSIGFRPPPPPLDQEAPRKITPPVSRELLQSPFGESSPVGDEEGATLLEQDSTAPVSIATPGSNTISETLQGTPPTRPSGFNAASLLSSKNVPGVGESSPIIVPAIDSRPTIQVPLTLEQPSVPPHSNSAASDSTPIPSGGFSASNLLGSFAGDDAEMLRAPPTKVTPPSGGGGWTLQAPTGSLMLDGESGLIPSVPSLSSAPMGLLPSSTPASSESGAPLEKVLDRVEDDLVFFSKNFQIILKGGTISKVIEKLTAESQAGALPSHFAITLLGSVLSVLDNSVVDTFLLTYRKFILPENLLEKLFERYNLKPAQPLSAMDAHSLALHEHSLKIVRLRVGNFIKRWLSEHFQDFRGNEALIDRLAVMCKQMFLQNERTLGEKILNTLEEQRQKLDARHNRAGVARGERPEPIVPKSGNYEDFDPVEVARQICLYEQNIYRQIHPKECLDQCWSKPDRYERAPNLMKLIDLFNCFASWVATQVLKHPKLDGTLRHNEVKKFMRMAIELRKLNNFNGCQEVLAGLNDSSIFRLSATWIKVEKDKKLFEDFQDVKRSLSPDRSWVTYRALLKEIQPPCIPYVGVYLTDLTFIEDGNSNYLVTEDGRTDIINFEKCRKQGVVIGNILLYQQDQYNFDRVDAISVYFERGLAFTDDKEALFKLSRSIEPPDMVEEAKKKAARKVEKDRKKNEKKAKDAPAQPRSASGSVQYPSQASMRSMASRR